MYFIPDVLMQLGDAERKYLLSIGLLQVILLPVAFMILKKEKRILGSFVGQFIINVWFQSSVLRGKAEDLFDIKKWSGIRVLPGFAPKRTFYFLRLVNRENNSLCLPGGLI